MKTSISLFFLLLAYTHLFAQEADSSKAVIITKNGQKFTGKIIEQNELETKLALKDSIVVTIPQDQIATAKENKPKPEAPMQTSRYVYSQTGYGLKKGEAYYQNVMLMYNNFSYGVTDHFSIGGGAGPFFVFVPEMNVPVWISPKVSIPIVEDVLNIGGGVTYAYLKNEINDAYGYGNITIGSRRRNVSVGYGHSLSQNVSGIIVAGEFEVVENIYAIGEIFKEGDFFLYTASGRIILENYSVFGGVIAFEALTGLFPLPVIGCMIPIGKK